MEVIKTNDSFCWKSLQMLFNGKEIISIYQPWVFQISHGREDKHLAWK